MDGESREVARKKIVERLEAAGILEKIEPHSHVVPHGDRSNVVIEPFLTDQWYVERQGAGEARDRRGARRQDQVRPAELGSHLFQLDGKHPALVHLAPALVGASNSGVVWARPVGPNAWARYLMIGNLCRWK